MIRALLLRTFLVVPPFRHLDRSRFDWTHFSCVSLSQKLSRSKSSPHSPTATTLSRLASIRFVRSDRYWKNTNSNISLPAAKLSYFIARKSFHLVSHTQKIAFKGNYLNVRHSHRIMSARKEYMSERLDQLYWAQISFNGKLWRTQCKSKEIRLIRFLYRHTI